MFILSSRHGVAAEEANEAHSQLTELRRAYEKKLNSEGRSIQEADKEHSTSIHINSSDGNKDREDGHHDGADSTPPISDTSGVSVTRNDGGGKKQKKGAKKAGPALGESDSNVTDPTIQDIPKATTASKVPTIHMVRIRYF